MLERNAPDHPLAFGVGEVVVAVVVARDAQSLDDRHSGRRPERGADLDGFFVVDAILVVQALVAVSVVDADVHVAIVHGKDETRGHAVVRRSQESLDVRKGRSLEAVAVDRLDVVDPGRPLEPETQPGAPGREVVEVDLPVAVLDPEGLVARERAACSRLGPDVGSDAEGKPVGEVSCHVDIGARQVEGVLVDRDLVAVHYGRRVLIRVIGEEHDPDVDLGGVVRRRVAGGGCDLRADFPGDHQARGCGAGGREPDKAILHDSCSSLFLAVDL